MEINIPSYVELVLDRLEKRGYEAYLVGGSIRDILLGKEPHDYDVTTNALPEQIEEAFNDMKTIDVGKRFGTICVTQHDGEVEITTFRKEGEYIDGRRPKWVSFCSEIEEDLSRRDFTINAIAYSRLKGIVDPFNGIEDLKKGIIRSVGDARERFKEDYLRILRAVRFSCQLDFEIEEETFLAGSEYSGDILKVSAERISSEFFKILLSDRPSKGIRAMETMGLLEAIIPELIPTIGFNQKNPNHSKDVFNHILCVLDGTPKKLHIRLAALFHDIGKPHTFTVDEEGIGHFYGHDKVGAEITSNVLERLKCSKELTYKVKTLVREHMTHHAKFKDKGIKRFIRRVGEENIYDLFELWKADRRCSNENASLENIYETEKRIISILEKKEPFKINQLDINGNDLMQLGLEEGKIIKDALEYLLDKVMEKPELNRNETLKELVIKKYLPEKQE